MMKAPWSRDAGPGRNRRWHLEGGCPQRARRRETRPSMRTSAESNIARGADDGDTPDAADERGEPASAMSWVIFDDGDPDHARAGVSLALRRGRRPARGSRTVITMPPAGGAMWQSISPPCAGHDLARHVEAQAEVGRPMRVTERVSGSNIFRMSFAATPAPWSRTAISARPSEALTATSIVAEPEACSMALARRIRRTPARVDRRQREHAPAWSFAAWIGAGPSADLCDLTAAVPTTMGRSTTSSCRWSWPRWIRLLSRRALDERGKAPGLGQRSGSTTCPPPLTPRESRQVPPRRAGGSCGWLPSAS